MPSIVVKSIDKCWTYDEKESDVVVKACAVTVENKRAGNTARAIVRSEISGNNRSFFDGLFVKECQPDDKGIEKCDIQIGDSFFEECDPKKDKKCNIRLEEMLFGK